jgi:hypothetical protein
MRDDSGVELTADLCDLELVKVPRSSRASGDRVANGAVHPLRGGIDSLEDPVDVIRHGYLLIDRPLDHERSLRRQR